MTGGGEGTGERDDEEEADGQGKKETAISPPSAETACHTSVDYRCIF